MRSSRAKSKIDPVGKGGRGDKSQFTMGMQLDAQSLGRLQEALKQAKIIP